MSPHLATYTILDSSFNRFAFGPQGDRFSLHVYVPRESNGLDSFLQALKNTSIDQIWGQIRKPGNCEKVHLSLPKFKIESEVRLFKPLKQVTSMQSYYYALWRR